MERFLLKRLRIKDGDPTLDDLLNDSKFSPMSAAFVVVSRRMTIADARARGG